MLCFFWTFSVYSQEGLPPGIAEPLPAPSPKKYGYQFHTDPDTFAIKFSELFERSQHSPTSQIGADWLASWKVDYSPEQQKQFMAFAMELSEKGYPLRPYFSSMAAAFNAAAATKKNQAFNSLFPTFQKCLKNYNAGQWIGYLNVVRSFCESQTVYGAGPYRLLVRSDDFSFEYVGGDESANTDPNAPLIFPSSDKPSDAKEDNSAFEVDEDIPAAPYLPALEGGIIKFGTADFVFSTAYDSFTVAGPKLTYMHNGTQMLGEGGTANWQILGKEPTELSVKFKVFSFDARSPNFTAEHAKLNDNIHLTQDALGVFSFKSERKVPNKAANYPFFKSYKGDFTHTDVGEGLFLKGGITLKGLQVSTGSVSKKPSYFHLRYLGDLKMKAMGPEFFIGDSGVTAPFSRTVLFFSKDSLTRNGNEVSYNKGSRLLRLYRRNGLFENVPYIDNYHNVEILCDLVNWQLDSATMDFHITQAKADVPALFDSREYFASELIDYINTGRDFDMINILMKHYNSVQNDIFNITEPFPNYWQKESVYKSSLQDLNRFGFIEFNAATGEVKMLQKIKHYAGARYKKNDYDMVSIPSMAGKAINGRLNLETKELTINGVKKLNISDSLGVFFEPEAEQVTLLENRNMRFDGKIDAGAFKTFGRKFKFDYDKFLVTLTEIDSIYLKSDFKKPRRQYTKRKPPKYNKLESQKNAVDQETGKKYTTGTLYIDKPDNRSSRKKNAQFPFLDVLNNAYVYFDGKDILGGAYNENVYFKVPPFNVDSIADADPKAINFTGEFTSDNIFPKFSEKLSLQKDGSLGFLHKVPKDGYKLYGGDAVFFGEIRLNKKGIRGRGLIKYLNTDIKSEDFVFYQDSVLARGTGFNLKGGKFGNTEFPDVTVKNFNMRWLPKEDSMILANIGKSDPFSMYGKTTQLDGKFIMTHNGSFGAGTVKRDESKVVSNTIAFKETSFSGREARFTVESADTLKPAVLCNNVRFDYDLKEKKAFFSPEEEGVASNEFPYMRMKTSIAQTTYDFEKKLVTMKMPEGGDIEDSYFYSTLPEHDSLHFNASQALYDVKTQTLTVSGIPLLKIADSEVYPDSGRMVILENANIQRLKNAIVKVDTINAYHNLTKADIKIISRFEYQGSAMYQYANANGDTLPIHFDAFEQIDKKVVKNRKVGEPRFVYTKSGGNITAEEPLKLSPGIVYKGKVTMIADKPNLIFDGQVALNTKQQKDRVWFEYKNTGENRDLSVNIQKAQDSTGRKFLTGLFYDDSGAKLYSRFIAPKVNDFDQGIMTVTGNLKFINETKEFRIGSPERLDEKTIEGGLFVYNDSLQNVQYEGKFDLIGTANQDKNFKVTASGLGRANLDTGIYYFNNFLILEPNIPSAAIKEIEGVLAKFAKESGGGENPFENRQDVVTKIAQLEGERMAKLFEKASENKVVPIHTIVPSLGRGWLMPEVQMNYNPKEQAFYSVGEIGFSSLNLTPVNLRIKGNIEIKKLPNGNQVSAYFEFDPDIWVYFRFDENKHLSFVSSIEKADEIVLNKINGKEAIPGQFSLVSLSAADKGYFLERFHKVYLNNHSFRDQHATEHKQKLKEEGAAQPAQPSVGETTEDLNADGEPKKKKKKKKKSEDEGDGSAAADPFADPNASTIEQAPSADSVAQEAPKKKKRKRVLDTDVPVTAPATNNSVGDSAQKTIPVAIPVSGNEAPKADTTAPVEPQPNRKKKKVEETEAAPDPFAEPSAEPKKEEPKQESPKQEEIKQDEPKPANVPIAATIPNTDSTKKVILDSLVKTGMDSVKAKNMADSISKVKVAVPTTGSAPIEEPVKRKKKKKAESEADKPKEEEGGF